MIHTFQLVTPPMTFSRYRRVENHVYDKKKLGICKITQYQEKLLGFCLPLYSGIHLCLNSLTVPHTTIVVNPARILGGGYHDLCCLTPELLGICMEPISRILQEFEMGFAVEQLILSRIDCTVDVELPEENILEAFISCVQRTEPARGYRIERFGKQYQNYKEMNRHSFRMACNDVCLTVYDKTYQLMNEELMDADDVPPGRLRFEAAFSNPAFQRLFARYGGGVFVDGTADGGTAGARIVWFSNISLRLLQDYFGQHMTPGQYLSKDLAIQRIERGRFSARTKQRMKMLLSEVAQCHKGGIRAALKNLEGEGFSENELRYLLRCFEKINLNPATINGSTGYQAFPSIAELLSNEQHFVKPFAVRGHEPDEAC